MGTDDEGCTFGSSSPLAQLFQNLIGNAVKVRREGVAPHVRVGAQRAGPCWHFSISDNGTDIAAPYQARIFEMFTRLHGRDRSEGSGLGLATCQKIVQGHGGRLWLESVPWGAAPSTSPCPQTGRERAGSRACGEERGPGALS